ILFNYDIYYAGYVTKYPHKTNISRLHQDPTFVHEEICKSLDVWSPMIPTDEKNGALHMIRNSNRFFPGYRGYTCKKYDYSDIRTEVQEKFGNIMKMQPGQAVMYDTATLHFSQQNETDDIRAACTCLVGPTEAEKIYFHHNKARNTLDVYKTDDDFIISYYRKYLNKDDLDLPLVSRTPFEPAIKVSFNEFEEIYHRYNPKPKKSFFDFFRRNK
ncbi:MAG: phytanoyl-CoA dioxygenase family protein, partial [Chitinophagales bacterium]|nr:phytanoyl-CoA dioxygenase family protein [Chitinophagales bacterium]